MQPSDVENWIEFLEEQGCTNIVDFGDWISFNCIFHEQTDKSRPSLGIYKETGCGKCFGCGTYSWKDFCEEWGISVVDFIDTVKENTWDRFRTKILGVKTQQTYKRFKLPNTLISPFGDRRCMKYITERTLDIRLLEKIGVKLCKDEGSKYYDYIIFPIYDEKGILFFDARYVGDDPQKPRWRRPKKCAFWKTYFNWENIKDRRRLIFVEGVTDAIKMIQFGFKETIPAKEFSLHQINMILNSEVETIVLMYDNDEAGRTAKNKNGKDIHFVAKAMNLFGNSGRDIVIGNIPDSYKDPAAIKTVEELIKINPKLKFL